MLNQVILIGKISNELKDLDEQSETILEVSVERAYKTKYGEPERDIIPVIVYGGLANSIKEFSEIGTTFAIKARIETRQKEIKIIAERVSYLSAPKKERE
jgi:single-stranded DNA-binding protein